MDLKKTVRGEYESPFYCSSGEVINQKNCKLLGFKGGIAVLSNAQTEAKEPPTSPNMNVGTKHILRVEVNSKTGEKFINLNGKKLKMLTGSQLPLHLKQKAQMIEATPDNPCTDKKPVKIKIIGSMPSIPAVKKEGSQLLDSNVLKLNVNNTDNGNHTHISTKTILIKESNLKLAKIPSADKHVNGTSTAAGGRTVISLNRASAHQTTIPHLNQEKDRIVNVITCNGVLKMNPLDLSTFKADSSKGEVQKADKCVQTENLGVTQAVQVKEDDLDEMSLINNISEEFLNFFNSPFLSMPGKVMPEVVPSKSTQLNTYSDKFSMFFQDLQAALRPNNYGNMPIHEAVVSNDINLVKRSCSILKALQQSVDILNNGDLSALQLAVINDVNPQIVKILLENGASLESVDSEDNNVLHLATEYKRTQMMDTLLRFADERKFNLNDFNAEGLTPLMICCCNNLLPCAELLLKYDADVNVRDRKSGRTALFHAAEDHNFEMVQLLLSYNADTKIKNFFGTSPHDAMYEVEEIPDSIKNAILGKSVKRKSGDEPKVLKVRRIEENIKLKTYARQKRIEGYKFPVNISTMANILYGFFHIYRHDKQMTVDAKSHINI